MARALLESAGGGAATGLLPLWLALVGMVVGSVWIVSLAVFLCGRSSHADDVDDLPKKKKKPAKASRPTSVAPRSKARSGGMVVDTTGMYVAAYVAGVASSGGCGGGGGGGGCGGGGGGGGC